jgi:predicted acylesterase/phospholipase RssA
LTADSFVCATSQQTGQVLCLRSYRSQRDGNSRLTDTIKIWQACRATSAATTFFEPITIGPYDQTFVDGALGDNNPVSKLWSEAKDIWGDELEKKLKCLVSIGTGLPNLSPVRDDVFRIFSTLKAIAVETEKTARDFHRDKSQLDNGGRYYRFNVQRGLEDIGLEESTKFGQLASATHGYLEDQAIFTQLQACAQKLSKNES